MHHLIQTYDRISRAEPARQTGLSKPTISSVVADLLASGLVLETGFAPSAGGRRAVLLAFNDRANFVVGMDLGGTTTRASLATLRGEFVVTLREPTTGLGAEALVVQLRSLIGSLCNLGVQSQGVVAWV